MTAQRNTTRMLWDRFLATRSDECRTALVEHYTPMVQMQTALWAYDFGTDPRGRHERRSFDGLAEPAADSLFLPFVPASTSPRTVN
jgi:hypothetical protein